MKREDVSKIFEGATDEQISSILNLNSADIGKAKEKAEAERDGLKGQLDTVNAALKKFDGVDVDSLKGQVQQLQTDLGKKESEYQQRIADMQFDSLLSGAVSAAKGKNAKAIRALLDVDALKASKNQSEDIQKALETLKGESGYLFENGETMPSYSGRTGIRDSSPTADEFRKMSYRERVSLFESNPELYSSLSAQHS